MALTTYGYLPDGPFSTDVLFVRSGSQTFYTHNDQLGTTLRLTDRAGNLVWAANYDAFGRARPYGGGSEMGGSSARRFARQPSTAAPSGPP